MFRSTRARMRALSAVGMAGVVTAIGAVVYDASAAVAPGNSRPAATPVITEVLKPPSGSRLVGTFSVLKGVQTYTCVVPAGAKGGFTGASVPEAQLVGAGTGIHHFGGPSWQSVRDGSLVKASKVESSARANTIPELLLQVTSHSGSGLLSSVDYINRLATSGGAAPTRSCSAAQTVSVPYHAVYLFWDAPDGL